MAVQVRRAGLGLSVGLAVTAAAAVGGVLVVLLPGGEGSLDAALPRTGPIGALISEVVAYVWVVLFAALGAAHWMVSRGGGRAGAAVLGLIAMCCLYPVLASGLEGPGIAIAGNIVVIATTLGAAAACLPVSRLAAVLVLPVAVWVSLATVGLVAVATGARF